MNSMMIRGFLLLAAVGCLHFGLHSEEIVITKITSGSIGLKKKGEAKFSEGKVGDVIPLNTWLVTGEDTDVTLTFYEVDRKGKAASSLQLGSYTKLTVTSFDVDDTRAKTDVGLRTGTIYSKVRKRKTVRNDYRIRTRQVTAAVRGTGSGHNASTDGGDMFVENGEVDSTNSSGETQNVTGGEQTDDQNNTSADLKLQGSQKSSVFSGGTGSENKNKQTTGNNSNDTPSSNTDSGDSNVGGSIQDDMGGDNADSGSGEGEGGGSSGGSGGMGNMYQ